MQPAEFRPAQNYDTNPYYDNAEWPGPGYVTVEPLTVTENDTYTAPEGKAYSPVTVNVSGGTLDVGNLLGFHSCNSDIAINGEYYPEYFYEGISSIYYESTEMVNDLNGFAPSNGIAGGLTVITVAQPIVENTVAFYKLTVEEHIITAIDDITDDIDFSVIDAGEGSFSVQLVIPSSELFSENDYFAITYEVHD